MLSSGGLQAIAKGSSSILEEFAMLWMNGDMKERIFHIQPAHKILGSDHGFEYVKILVGGFTIDRGLVEDTEGINDALLALDRSVNCPWEDLWS